MRDWFSLYQGDPKPIEGALLTEEQVQAATWRDELPEFVKTGVAIDPSGGGRDEAGVIGGGVTADGSVIWTHDRSGHMGSDEWARKACLLAQEIEAVEITYEKNFGGDQAKFLLRSVWAGLLDEGLVEGPCPRIVEVTAKRGKRVRAEPISVQVMLGKVYFHGLNVLELGTQWQTWQEDSKESPGRIDASCYLAYRWLKIPGSESVISTTALGEARKEPTGKGSLAGRRVVRPAAGR
jgi:phage terminase large subunit-like protein